jgi:hypothetical protein
MSQPIPVLLILIAFGVCVAQDTEKFAVELTSSPAAKRNELLAAHPEQITIALRKELIQHGNLRFATTDYARALEIYQLVERIAAQIDDKKASRRRGSIWAASITSRANTSRDRSLSKGAGSVRRTRQPS